jgi:integrase
MKGGEMTARLEGSEVEFSSRSSLDERGTLNEVGNINPPPGPGQTPDGRIRDVTDTGIPSANGKGVNQEMEGMLTAGSDSMLLMAAWGSWLRAQFAENTVEHYWGGAFRFLRRCPKPLQFVTEQDVAEWLESFPYRSASRVAGYEALRSLYGWMEGHGYVLINPVTGIRKPSSTIKEARALTESEFRLVYGAAWRHSPKRAHAAALLYYTGARASEVLNLEWDDVKSDHVLLRKTKNGSERKIPLTPMLYEALHGLGEAFPNETKVLPRSHQTVWKWVSDAGKEVGVHVTCHLFRATALTDMLNSGTPLQVAAKFAGHKNMKVTHRYAAAQEDQVREAAEGLHKIGLEVDDVA